MRPTSYIRRQIKKRVYKREKGQCFWCDVALTFEEATLDHIITAGRGGPFKPKNLVLACLPCNKRRDDLDPHQFALEQFQQAKAV